MNRESLEVCVTFLWNIHPFFRCYIKSIVIRCTFLRLHTLLILIQRPRDYGASFLQNILRVFQEWVIVQFSNWVQYFHLLWFPKRFPLIHENVLLGTNHEFEWIKRNLCWWKSRILITEEGIWGQVQWDMSGLCMHDWCFRMIWRESFSVSQSSLSYYLFFFYSASDRFPDEDEGEHQRDRARNKMTRKTKVCFFSSG